MLKAIGSVTLLYLMIDPKSPLAVDQNEYKTSYHVGVSKWFP